MKGARIRDWASRMKRDVATLWLALRDPRVGWPAKAVAAAVVAYALSPIDLIPDFIPVLGLLDDLILVPLGIAIGIRLIAPPVLADLRTRADAMARLPRSRAGMAIVIALWIAGAAALMRWALGNQ